MTCSDDGGICAATLPNNPTGTMWVTTLGGGPATLANVSFTTRAGMDFGIAFTTASVTARLRAFALPLGSPHDSFTWVATDVATSSRGSVGFVTGGNSTGFDACFTASVTAGRENDEDDFFVSTGLPGVFRLFTLWDPYKITIVTRRYTSRD